MDEWKHASQTVFQVSYLRFYGARIPSSFTCNISKVNSEVGAAAAARQAAGRIFRLQDEELLIDPLGEGGAKGGDNIAAAVEFKNIKFSYPERPDAQVCSKETRAYRYEYEELINKSSLCLLFVSILTHQLQLCLCAKDVARVMLSVAHKALGFEPHPRSPAGPPVGDTPSSQ